jgi:hypothetical protein
MWEPPPAGVPSPDAHLDLRPRWPLTDVRHERSIDAPRSAKKRGVFPSLTRLVAERAERQQAEQQQAEEQVEQQQPSEQQPSEQQQAGQQQPSEQQQAEQQQAGQQQAGQQTGGGSKAARAGGEAPQLAHESL